MRHGPCTRPRDLRACPRRSLPPLRSADRHGRVCQRRRRPRFPRASKGVTLLRIIRFSAWDRTEP
jgi:hypothetical protein